MQKYIRQMQIRFRSSKSRQCTRGCAIAGVPALMTASSSRLTEGCFDGSSWNQRHQNRLQITPSEPKIQNDARQPAAEMIRMTSGGAAAAPMRLLMNTAPCAAPRSVTGNQREKLREIFG